MKVNIQYSVHPPAPSLQTVSDIVSIAISMSNHCGYSVCSHSSAVNRFVSITNSTLSLSCQSLQFIHCDQFERQRMAHFFCAIFVDSSTNFPSPIPIVFVATCVNVYCDSSPIYMLLLAREMIEVIQVIMRQMLSTSY